MSAAQTVSISMETLPIDEDTLPLFVLMVMATTQPGRWDDVSLARLFDIKPSTARAVLADLVDMEMIYWTGMMGYTISVRGLNNVRIYLPGNEMPKA